MNSATGNRCRACTGRDDPHVLLLFADDLQRIGQARKRDDRRAVLVVVEDGDVTALLELALDLKAAGGCDVLQVYPAKGTGNQVNGVDDLVHILAFDAHGEGVHIPKGLK